MQSIINITTTSDSPVYANLLGLFIRDEKMKLTFISSLLPINERDNKVATNYVHRVINPNHHKAVHDNHSFFMEEGETPLEGYKRTKITSLENEITLFKEAIKQEIPVSNMQGHITTLQNLILSVNSMNEVQTVPLQSILQIKVKGVLSNEDLHRLKYATSLIADTVSDFKVLDIISEV